MSESRVEIFPDGTKRWFNKLGLRHRLDGPAIEWSDGSMAWWVDGKRHRLDGPAIEDSDGLKKWFVNDKLHRLDGPAVEKSNGYKEWWINGKKISQEKFELLRKILSHKIGAEQ